VSTNTAGSPATAAQRTRSKGRPEDRIFFGLSFGSATLIMVILAAVALFLIVKAMPAIVANWQTPDLAGGTTAGHSTFWGYVGPLIWGTIWISAIALVIGAPIAIGIALFISHYAPRRLAGVLGYLVDLLAAVPSVVFGLWGIFVIRPFLLPLEQWLNTHLNWIPIFSGPPTSTGSTVLAGAVVLAVMILPIISSISREIFLQTPRLHEEAALALGATKWEMIADAVVPYARSGIIGGIILGLGRALGETMAVTMLIGNRHEVAASLFAPGYTMAAAIANEFAEAVGDMHLSALAYVAFLLFVVTVLVNAGARLLIWRVARGSGAGSKAL